MNVQIVKQFVKLVEIERLRMYLIHSRSNTFFFVAFLNVAGDSNYNGLVFLCEAQVVEVWSHLASALDSIHNRHAEISDDQSVCNASQVGLFREGQSLFTRDAVINSRVIHTRTLQIIFHDAYAEFFIIYHHDSVQTCLHYFTEIKDEVVSKSPCVYNLWSLIYFWILILFRLF